MGRKKKNKSNSKENGDAMKLNIHGDTKRGVAAVSLFAVALLVLLGFFDIAGPAGESLDKLASFFVGWTKFILPIFLTMAGVILLLRKETSFYVSKLAGLSVALVALSGFFHWFYGIGEMKEAAEAGSGGGYIGYALAYAAVKYLEKPGGLVVILALLIIGVIISFNFPIVSIWQKLKEIKEREKEDEMFPAGDGETGGEEEKIEIPGEEQEKEAETEDNIENLEFVDGHDRYVDEKLFEKLSSGVDSIKKSFSKKSSQRKPKRESQDPFDGEWQLPPLSLLDENGSKADAGDIDRNVAIIVKKFQDFGIGVTPGETTTGPTVTQYTFRPAQGVKISRIMSLQDDLALALAARSIRIEAPIPGKSFFGVEVPNKDKATVRLRSFLESQGFQREKKRSSLTIPVGEDVSGDYIFSDLGKMPHLLVAGATNTGKSICLNAIILSLLYQNSPKKLRMLMVDPKRVELSRYEGIPHLASNVITESSKAVNVLRWAVGEMEKRFRSLQDISAVNIESYNTKIRGEQKRKYTDPETGEVHEEDMEPMPYIVIVIDEVAELMVRHSKEVEGAIVRLTQMARAVGIHLIVSTQRPEVKIITGLIKANIINRIALKVATQVDSRTIIDAAGADKLLGSGDMLFLSPNSSKPKRIQGVFISESEVERVVKFLISQKKDYEKETGEEILQDIKDDSLAKYKKSSEEEREDAIYEAAKAEIIRSKKASATYLQRRLKIGYPKAARILDMLEEKGIIGPAEGAKPREVLVSGATDGPDYEYSAEDQQKREKWQI